MSLWEPPLPSVSRVGELTQFMRLAMLLRRNLGRALNIQRFVEGFRPRRPHWYLTYIASAPEHQGQGFGSRVLEPMLELTDRARLPIYLECSNRDNVGFYVRHGFNIVAEVAIPETGHTIWPMLREPREA